MYSNIMSIPLPDIFGDYSKSIWVFPIFIFGYMLFQSKDMILIIPLIAYFILFIGSIVWFEEFFVKRKEPIGSVTNIFISLMMFNLNFFYIIAIVALVISLNILNDIIAFFIVFLAILAYFYGFFKAFRMAKPHFKEMLRIGGEINVSSKKVIKRKKGEKLTVDAMKKRAKKEIDKLSKEIKKNRK